MPIFLSHASIKLDVFDTPVLKEIAKYLKELHELTKNENFMICLEHFWKHSIKEFEFSGNHIDPIDVLLWIASQEKIRVVAYLSKLHHCISETLVSFSCCRIDG